MGAALAALPRERQRLLDMHDPHAHCHDHAEPAVIMVLNHAEHAA